MTHHCKCIYVRLASFGAFLSALEQLRCLDRVLSKHTYRLVSNMLTIHLVVPEAWLVVAENTSAESCNIDWSKSLSLATPSRDIRTLF
jgi:hypothetical protein